MRPVIDENATPRGKERRASDEGDMRRDAEHVELLFAKREALDAEIAQTQEQLAGAESGADEEDAPTRFRLHCVELRPLKAMWCLLNYAELREVLFDGKRPSIAALYFTHVLVIISGGNLKSIVAGLRMHTQWVIEEYDERNGAAPMGKPCVSAMDFITDDIPRAVATLRLGGSLRDWRIGEKGG